MRTPKTKFSKRLRELRLERNLTIQEAARGAIMDPNYYGPIERSTYAPPAADKIKRIAKAFKVDPTELLILAGKLPRDIEEEFLRRPLLMAQLIRVLKFRSDQFISDVVIDSESLPPENKKGKQHELKRHNALEGTR